jgi:stage V sporulation protein SpoVS
MENIEKQSDNLLKIRGEQDGEGAASNKAYVKKLASAILTVLDKFDDVRLKAVGASSVNNAVKSFIIAKNMSKRRNKLKNIELVLTADFDVAKFDQSEKTAIMFTVFAEEVE